MPIFCFLTGTIPPLDSHFLISRNLTLPKLYELGVELGLNIIKLKGISSIELPLELCERWLREDDAVYQTSGRPNLDQSGQSCEEHWCKQSG